MSTTLTNPQREAVAPSAPAIPLSAVRASGLQLDGRRGRIYGPLDLDIAAGTVNLVTGRAGSGRTSLLLTLVGRMRPNRGSDLVVLGRPLPARAAGVQRRSAAVGVHGLDDLDEEVTVAAAVRERKAWLAPWYRTVRSPDDDLVAEICSSVFGRNEVPRARQLIHQLDETTNLQLRLALAMLSEPQLVVVDDIDALHDTDSRRLVWESLRALAEHGVTVIASASTDRELTRLGWDALPQHIALPAIG